MPSDTPWQGGERILAQGRRRRGAKNPTRHKKGLHGTACQTEEDHDAAVGSCLPGASGRSPVLMGRPHVEAGQTHTEGEVGEAESWRNGTKKVTPDEKSEPLRALRVVEIKRGRDGALTVKSHTSAKKRRGGGSLLNYY